MRRIILFSFFFIILSFNVRGGRLMLVGPDNPVEEGHAPETVRLEPELCYGAKNIRLAPEAAGAFMLMAEACAASGNGKIAAVSGYRSVATQKRIFEREIKNTGKSREAIAAYIAVPGTSEHQTGLAVDITTPALAAAGMALTGALADTPQGRWVKNHCYEYGFVIRYPQGKSHVTGIIHEPWHLRYAGLPHAAIMSLSELALEEYYSFWETHEITLLYMDDSFFVTVSDDGTTGGYLRNAFLPPGFLYSRTVLDNGIALNTSLFAGRGFH